MGVWTKGDAKGCFHPPCPASGVCPKQRLGSNTRGIPALAASLPSPTIPALQQEEMSIRESCPGPHRWQSTQVTALSGHASAFPCSQS